MNDLFTWLHSRKLLKLDTFTASEIKAAARSTELNSDVQILKWLANRGVLSEHWTSTEIVSMYTAYRQVNTTEKD